MYKFLTLLRWCDGMSISILLSYIFLGLTFAAPMGPVNSAKLDKGIKNGFWHAWTVGTGARLADIFFMSFVYFGLLQILNIPVIKIFLWLFGSFVLLYTGIESILKANLISLQQSRKKESIVKCFITGYFMSITSPLTLLFWLGIYGSVLAETAATNGNHFLILYSSMILLGLALWDIFFAFLTIQFRKYLNYNLLIIISLISGFSLIGFGVYFGYLGVKALFS